MLHRDDINIADISDVSSIDLIVFAKRLGSAISKRGLTAREHTTFDPTRAGHIIKLIVGLVQHYGALTFEEIDTFLYCLEITGRMRQDLGNFLLCAEFVKWIIRDRRGATTYYSTRVQKEALQFKFKKEIEILDKDRWRADIRDYWRTFDSDRFSSIQKALGNQGQ